MAIGSGMRTGTNSASSAFVRSELIIFRSSFISHTNRSAQSPPFLGLLPKEYSLGWTRYLSSALSKVFTHESVLSGRDNSLSVCPVGALSRMIRSDLNPYSVGPATLLCQAFLSILASSRSVIISSMPGRANERNSFISTWP